MFAALESPSAPKPQSASLFEDLIDVWFSPSSVFARRPQGSAWGPFAVVTLLLAALYFGALGPMQPMFDAEAARALAQAQSDNAALTAEQLEQMRKVMDVSIKYGGIVAMPIVLLVVGAGVWIVGRALGGNITLAGGIMIGSFAYLPKALELLLVIVQSFVLDTTAWSGRFDYSWGVGRFLDPGMGQGVYLLLGRLDLFTFWVTALCAIGLVHAAGVPKARAAVAGVALWALGAVPALLQVMKGA